MVRIETFHVVLLKIHHLMKKNRKNMISYINIEELFRIQFRY